MKRSLHSGLAAFGLVACASFVTTAASANSGGVAGYTGKPNFSAPQGESCQKAGCHGGGGAPQVSIMGPSSLAAGQSGDYTLIVSTNAARAGAAVAATDGVKLANLAGFADSFGELVQTAPMGPSGGQATFQFRVTAPLSGTTLKLWAVGLAANNNGGTTGDAAAQTTRDITITGGAPVTPGGNQDAGASSSSSGNAGPGSSSSSGGSSGSSSSSGSSGSSGADEDGDGEPDDEEDEESASSPRRRSTPAAGAACSASPIGSTGEVMTAGFALLAVAAISRRRRGA